MSNDHNPRSRVELMVAAGTLSDADVRWFTRPYGLLELCRAAVHERSLDALNDLPLDELGEQLDDQSAAFGAQLPSQRIAALVAAAHIAAGHTGAQWRSMLADGLGPLGAAAARDLVAYMDGTAAASRAVASVPIVVSRHAFGELTRFSVGACVRDSDVGLDIVDAPFMRVDDEFVAAIERARTAVRFEGGARWMLASARTGQPVDAIAGASVALGAAVALGGLTGGAERFRVDPTWVFTGDLDGSDGSTRGLVGPTGASEYASKLRALGERATLVFPEPDAEHVSTVELANDAIKLAPVTSVDELVRTLERHTAGTAEYARVVSGQPTRHRPRRRTMVLSTVAVLAAVVAVVSAVRTWGDDDLQAQARGTLSPLLIDPSRYDDPTYVGLGAFRIDLVEVNNKRYRACVDAGECTPPSVAIPKTDWQRPEFDDYPITGITAEQAEAFCDFARKGWGLPTRDQFRFVVENVLEYEFPRKSANLAAELPDNDLPAEIAKVGDGLVAGQPRWITGNVRELTRTECDLAPTPCVDHARITGRAVADVFIFGIDFYDMETIEQLRDGFPYDRNIGTGWFDDEHNTFYHHIINESMPTLGFRCAQETTT